MFPDDMIAKKWLLGNRRHVLWNPSIFDGINQKKDKKEDTCIYVLLVDESLIQQLKKKQLDIQAILE
jgi:hypothetical protein